MNRYRGVPNTNSSLDRNGNPKILSSYFDRIGELLGEEPRTKIELAVDMYESPELWGLEEENPEWEGVNAKKILSKDPEGEEVRKRWKQCRKRIRETYAVLEENQYLSSNYGSEGSPLELRSDRTAEEVKSIQLSMNLEE